MTNGQIRGGIMKGIGPTSIAKCRRSFLKSLQHWAQKVQRHSGMPAEVMLMDGEHSLFTYPLAPQLNGGRRGLREN
ncbi:hypothetical protein EV129_108179 [Rhizobium azibense]|uniref:Uncharacterized protein n=1 Tax=Rhizobium azibense TaxID=1136135 RepID=A0A4R3RQH0_9HYPH|nr:hypothetical protein EV129_108179 [Rhizobium azibense]